MTLPPVDETSPLRDLLLARRSTKHLKGTVLTLKEVSSLLWAVAGTTTGSRRVCPSARALYPLSTTLIAGQVEGLDQGAYHYVPAHHRLGLVRGGDHRRALAEATIDATTWLGEGPALLLLTADIAAAPGLHPDQPPEHGERFIWIETGHAAQNVYLWAAQHHLATALIAGFDDARMNHACRPFVAPSHRALAIMPVGHPAV